MSQTLTRIQLRWQHPITTFQDVDALGLYEFAVSTQGASFRPNRIKSEDLWAARCYLETNWTAVEHTTRLTYRQERGYDRHNRVEHTETWHRLAAPRPGDEQW